MTPACFAYMPLVTYPEAVADAAIQAAISLAKGLGCTLQATAFAVDLPRASSGLGDYLINSPAIVRAAEEKSGAEADRLADVVQKVPASQATCSVRRIHASAVLSAAVSEARYFDIVLLPWSSQSGMAQDLAQSIVFDSGRPAILVPPGAQLDKLSHLAIAWDGSRVAARAMADALQLVPEGGRVSVLTVEDEKQLAQPNLAETLVSWLEKRGFGAASVRVSAGGQSISDALQQATLSSGSQMLAMGGFGHSRVRDFVLGGATKGVLARLKIPVLLSH